MDTHLSLFWGQLIGLDQISKLLILRSLLNTCGYLTYYDGVFHDGSVLTNLPTMQETQEMRVQSLSQEDSLQEETVIHSSILARKIPWTEEPYIGLQRVRHD